MAKKLSVAERARRPRQSGCHVYTVPEAGKMAGLSRAGSYAAAKDGTIPTLTLGKLKKVPAAAWHKILGE